MLKKCLHGLTQNQNESFNSMIWERIPKTHYVGLTQLELGVYDAVANFNIGRKASILIYEQMKIVPGKHTLAGVKKLNNKRLKMSRYDSTAPVKKRRKLRRGRAKHKSDKTKAAEGSTYEAGAF